MRFSSRSGSDPRRGPGNPLPSPHTHLCSHFTQRKTPVLLLGGWPPLTFSICLALLLPSALLIPNSFPGNYFQMLRPCHGFSYPSPAALLGQGGNIFNKPQTRKLTHFSFAKAHFLCTRPRSKLWTHFLMLYYGSLKPEKSLDGSYSKSWAISTLKLIMQAPHSLVLSLTICSSTSCVSTEIQIP